MQLARAVARAHRRAHRAVALPAAAAGGRKGQDRTRDPRRAGRHAGGGEDRSAAALRQAAGGRSAAHADRADHRGHRRRGPGQAADHRGPAPDAPRQPGHRRRAEVAMQPVQQALRGALPRRAAGRESAPVAGVQHHVLPRGAGSADQHRQVCAREERRRLAAARRGPLAPADRRRRRGHRPGAAQPDGARPRVDARARARVGRRVLDPGPPRPGHGGRGQGADRADAFRSSGHVRRHGDRGRPSAGARLAYAASMPSVARGSPWGRSIGARLRRPPGGEAGTRRSSSAFWVA